MITSVQGGGNNLDTTDEHLLELLADDARMSATALGEKVGLSGSAVRRRLKRLENGTILKYTIVQDRSKRGASAEAYMEVTFIPQTNMQAFVNEVIKIPEVREASQIAGRPDVLLRLRADSNDRIGEVLNEIRDFPEVDDTKTLTVLHRQRHVWGAREAMRES